mmetsp:Transcript_142920/g.398228  ORF Transcript_142920/g.398228 Transcript_142920/m.398228 type:complete len:251 (+) Transcript_142920:160-912(+)
MEMVTQTTYIHRGTRTAMGPCTQASPCGLSICTHVHSLTVDVWVSLLNPLDLFALGPWMVPGLLQLFLASLASRYHHLLIHHLLLLVALTVQGSHIVDLYLAFEFCKVPGPLRVVLVELIRYVVVHVQRRSRPLIAVLRGLGEGETAPPIARGKIRGERQQHEKQDGQHLQEVLALHLARSLVVVATVAVVVVEGVEGGTTTAEKGGKEVLWGHEVLLVGLAVLMWDPLLIAIFVVYGLFLVICQTLDCF